MSGNKRTTSLVLALALALIVSVANADFTFGEPTVLTTKPVTSPSISTNGLTLYFCAQDKPANWNIWVATWEPTDGEPTSTPTPPNSAYSDATPDISADDLTLYFTSYNRPGGEGRSDIWLTTRATPEEPWSEPVNLGPTINSEYYEGHPSISSDSLSLYFVSDRPGEGSRDIYVSTRATIDDPWSDPVNLGPIVNSPSRESGPDISSDGLTLFFSSWWPYGPGEGDDDIWFTRRATTDDPWDVPRKLGPIINDSAGNYTPCVSADGSILYWCSEVGGLRQAPIKPVVDLNGDGDVNAQDMSILIDHWHTSDPLCDIGPPPLGDSIVDIQDMIVLSEYLEPGFGRIAHWKLDETEGTVAYDSIGSDHANVHGEAVWQPEAGQMAGALEFDGKDDYVVPVCKLNPVDGPFRILAWIKGGAPGQVIASYTPADSVPGGTYLAADPTDGTLMTKAVLPMPLKSDAIITDDEWHKVGFEWDGKYRRLSVDENEVAVDDMVRPAVANTGYLNIGTGMEFEDGTYWSGLIDDVRVYIKGSG